jgi:hypothetical protein
MFFLKHFQYGLFFFGYALLRYVMYVHVFVMKQIQLSDVDNSVCLVLSPNFCLKV